MRLWTGVLIVASLLVGCDGAIDQGPGTDSGIVPPKPTCASGETLRCVTYPDRGEVCTCEPDIFDPCEKYPQKYCAPMPVPPDGSSDWECTWNELEYTCKRKDNGQSPGGGGDWTCTQDSEGGWTCVKSDVPGGGGEWKCFVDNESDVLVCEKQPDGGLSWSCTTGADGKKTCTSTGGLPTGGSSWKCHPSGDGWVCYGEVPSGSPPPGGGTWQCTKVKSELGKDVYRCQKSGNDTPDGGSNWTCVKGSELGGTSCVEGGPGPTPAVGGKCSPGTKAWCDGHTYCGWGQVQCDPGTGTWATEVKDGKVRLKCYEVNDLRPNTVCACYHTFYNKDCCERPDCIIPAGTQGQVCPKSPGKLCDYCNPLKPECSEPGGKCMVTNNHETFCGRSCSTSQPCPAGYSCQGVKTKSGLVQQCVPVDLSCYY